MSNLPVPEDEDEEIDFDRLDSVNAIEYSMECKDCGHISIIALSRDEACSSKIALEQLALVKYHPVHDAANDMCERDVISVKEI